MEIRETELPGVGSKFEFRTKHQGNVGVIVHHDGRREVFICDEGDPDCAVSILNLDADESSRLADVLGGDTLSSKLHSTLTRIDELSIDWITIEDDSPFKQRPVGAATANMTSGVSVVAIIRGEDSFASPKSSFELQVGDVLVIVGSSAGVRKLTENLGG